MKHSAVYRAQCRTFALAMDITGKRANVTSGQAVFAAPYCLRLLKPYRTPDVVAFRDQVALAMRKIRKGKKI